MKLCRIVELFYKPTNWRHFTLQLCPLISYYHSAKLELEVPGLLNRFILFQCLQMLYGTFIIGRLFRLAYLLETNSRIEELISADPFFAVIISKSTFLQYSHSVTSCAILSTFIVYVMYILAFGLPLQTMAIFYSLVNQNCLNFFRLNRAVQCYLCSLQFSSLVELKTALENAAFYLWRNNLPRKRKVRFAQEQLPGFPFFSVNFRLKLLTVTWAVEIVGIVINLGGG